MEVKELHWYVLKAISGKEQKVKEYIELDMKNHGYEDRVSQVLIPQENIIKVGANNKRIPAKRNLLPGYVLVEAALDGEITHMLRNTPNVLGFLGGTDKPSPVRQAEVNRMLGLGQEEEMDVAETAVNDYLIWYYTNVERGHWKKCSRCGEVKLAHNNFFSKNKSSKDGWYSICKECRNRKS